MITMEDVESVLASRQAKPAEEKPAQSEQKETAAAGTTTAATETKSTETSAPAEPAQPDPVRDVLAEYGVSADAVNQLGVQPEVLYNRVSELEAELELERQRKYNPVYNLSEEELNEKIEKLRDDGKHTDAEKMLREWSEKDSKGSSHVLEARRKAAEKEVLTYISQGNGNEKLADLLQDKALQPVLKDLTGIINLHLPGAARVLHRLCLGFKIADIARKAEERGRNSISMPPPAGHKAPAAAAKSNLFGARKPKLSELLK